MAESIEQLSFELTASVRVESHLETNCRKIASLSDCLAASCALLVAEVILWTLSLIG